MSANTPEPAPIKNSSRPIWELVVDDMVERDRTGRNKYGVPLQAGNGRDPLVDAYQESLDLAVYLRQEIAECSDNPHAHDWRLMRGRLATEFSRMRVDGDGLSHAQEQRIVKALSE